MSVKESAFGRLESGEEVTEFVLSNEKGDSISVISYGATLRAWKVGGGSKDIVLGYDHLKDYVGLGGSLGKTIGRVANRIRHGRFTLDSRDIQLPVNKPPHHCHGGKANFTTKVWGSETVKSVEEGGVSLKFSCSSKDGEEGYPGQVCASVTYTLLQDGSIRLDYDGQVTGSATPLNLTNHAYFNLGGHDKGSLQGHSISVQASRYLPTDSDNLVTGEVASVKGTPFDLTSPKDLVEGIQATGNGYDNNFCIDGADEKTLKLGARVEGHGLALETHTTQPGVQLYTANFLNQKGCKGGAEYGPHGSFCLETQGWPDAVNQPHFPSVILRPGQRYAHTTIYRISSL